MSSLGSGPKILPIRLDKSEPPPLLHGILAADLSTDFDAGFYSLLSAMGIAREPAPFSLLPDVLHASTNDAPAALEAALKCQDMTVLTSLWYYVVASANQLKSELKEAKPSFSCEHAPVANVESALKATTRGPAVVFLPRIALLGIHSLSPATPGTPVYFVEVVGLDSLLSALRRWPKQVVSRQLLLTPSEVLWTSDMVEDADGKIEFR